MSSSVVVRYNIGIVGSTSTFATKYPTPFLSLEADPALYDLTVDADGTATVWDGAPLVSSFDILAMVADQDCDVEFTVDGGQVDEYHFTLFLRGGGFPLFLTGDAVYAGQSGTQDSFTSGTLKTITKIRIKNRNTDDAALVSVLIGKAA